MSSKLALGGGIIAFVFVLYAVTKTVHSKPAQTQKLFGEGNFSACRRGFPLLPVHAEVPTPTDSLYQKGSSRKAFDTELVLGAKS